jgi:hypothetical protein
MALEPSWRAVQVHQGSCLCGSIRYRIESDLKAVVNCHCRFCRKAHGSPFTTLLFLPFSSLKILQGAEVLVRYRVERLNAERCFCSKCGTRLYNHMPSLGTASVVVATLDIDQTLRPVAHLNTESKCSWHQITDQLPQFLSAPGPKQFTQLLTN